MEKSLVYCTVLAFPGGPATTVEVSKFDTDMLARRILDASGIHGGLVVHLGCGSGRLTAAQRAEESCLVHGRDADAAKIADACEHAQSLGLHRAMSFRQWTDGRLPYSDKLVSLLLGRRWWKLLPGHYRWFGPVRRHARMIFGPRVSGSSPAGRASRKLQRSRSEVAQKSLRICRIRLD